MPAQQSERSRTNKSQSINRSLSPNKPLLFSARRLSKADLYDFYVKTLQSLEQVKFSAGLGSERQDSGDPAIDYIVNFEDAVEEKDKEVCSVLTRKLGKQFFCTYPFLINTFHWIRRYSETDLPGLRRQRH